MDPEELAVDEFDGECEVNIAVWGTRSDIASGWWAESILGRLVYTAAYCRLSCIHDMLKFI
jgi:hypothetical protein